MSRANCCCGLNSSARPGIASSSAASAVETRAKRWKDRGISHSVGLGSDQFLAAAAVVCKPASSPLYAAAHHLFRILHRDDLDLDQEARISERGDADHRTRRQVGLAAAEELGVALHEGSQPNLPARSVVRSEE